MTLYRQLILIVSILFITGFIGTISISTANLRHFIDEQLTSHAQDTATSLGLSLSAAMQSNDLPVMDAMIDAIFDRGYYRYIAVIDVDGTTLAERSNPVRLGNVPAWFVNNITLETPTAEALVMSSWKQAGTVQVSSHPGYAYRELWQNTMDTFWMFFLTALTVMLLGLLVIRVLLRPLQGMESQAEAICNRNYTIQEKLPRTRELRRVVEAMNRLSHKVNESFSEHSALTERLRTEAYLDPLTGAGNRRWFNRQFQNLAGTKETSAPGALLLVELHQLDAVNDTSGYPAGDHLLQRAARLLDEGTGNIGNCYLFRISGAGFAVLAVNMTATEADTLAGKLCNELLQLHVEGIVTHLDIAHIGIALWKPGSTTDKVLAEADIAMRSAQASGENTWKRYEPMADNQAPIRGKTEWRNFLKDAITNENITLLSQPVYRVGTDRHTLLHTEILSRITDTNGEPVPAGIFMPMAERLNLASELDKVTIGKLLDHVGSDADMSQTYAVNIASSSLHDPAFIDWLFEKLSAKPDCRSRLIFELPEHSVLRDTDVAISIIQRLTKLGCGCGIDHFGRCFHSLGYLRNIGVQYLKIDGPYIHGIDQDSDNRFFVQALSDTAHSIDIQIIAEAVETEAEAETIGRLNVDGIQGFLSGKPEPV
ncbi:MAG: EAL domain-containing protein [Pseudomonadota bacterium]